MWERGERKRKYFRKAEQSKDILNKHQDAIEKMVRRWQTDLCVVSDENGTMEITNNCVVCYRLSCILVTCHIIPSSLLFATQSVSCLHCRLFHMPRPSNPQTNKPTNTPGWEASDAHCSLFIHSRQACMQILYLFTGKW